MNSVSVNKRLRRQARSHPAAARGITVVELLMTLSISAILLAVGIPTYSGVMQKNRIGTTSNLLYTSLNAARGEAVKRRGGVRVCPSANGSSCRGDGDWSEGWLLFEDQNSNNAPDSTEIIRVVDGLESGIAIEVSTPISGYLQFQPTGIMTGSGGNAGEFRICHAESSVHSHVLSVSPAGQVRLAQRTQPDCGETA